jgi:flavin reductase (DIM6/NTAB) family NADH-FMN oxidoreductase RutF
MIHTASAMAGTCVDAARFRQSVSRFATGIAIVSCLNESGRPHGMTISSFTSVSLDPASVLVSLRPGRTRSLIRRDGWFGISVLGSDQEHWSRHFSGQPQQELDIAWTMKSNVPVLRDALAWFECQVDSLLQVHDHTLFVARVVDCDHASGNPLMFYASRYHRPGSGG